MAIRKPSLRFQVELVRMRRTSISCIVVLATMVLVGGIAPTRKSSVALAASASSSVPIPAEAPGPEPAASVVLSAAEPAIWRPGWDYDWRPRRWTTPRYGGYGYRPPYADRRRSYQWYPHAARPRPYAQRGRPHQRRWDGSQPGARRWEWREPFDGRRQGDRRWVGDDWRAPYRY